MKDSKSIRLKSKFYALSRYMRKWLNKPKLTLISNKEVFSCDSEFLRVTLWASLGLYTIVDHLDFYDSMSYNKLELKINKNYRNFRRAALYVRWHFAKYRFFSTLFFPNVTGFEPLLSYVKTEINSSFCRAQFTLQNGI